MTEKPYPEAPLASRKAPLSEGGEGSMTPVAPGQSSVLGSSLSESRADPKPPPRWIDPEVFGVFHAKGHDCLTCGYYRASAHHLVKRSQGGDDVLDNLIPLCGACHGSLHDGNTHHAYGVTHTPESVRNRIGQFLLSEAGADHLAYVHRKLGTGAGVFLEKYGVWPYE